MGYRTKLFTLLICLVVISNGLLASANYLEFKSTLQMEIHRKSRAIAATIAGLLNPEMVESIRHHADETTPVYANLQSELRKGRDRNRGNHTCLHHASILMESQHDTRLIHTPS